MGLQDIVCCTKDGKDERLLKFGLCLPARPLLGYLSTFTSRPLGGALPTENGSRLRRDFKASKPKSSAQKRDSVPSPSLSLSIILFPLAFAAPFSPSFPLEPSHISRDASSISELLAFNSSTRPCHNHRHTTKVTSRERGDE